MNLALTILFMWLGFVLLFVAFHPLSLETSTGSPRDILRAIQNQLAGVTPENQGRSYLDNPGKTGEAIGKAAGEAAKELLKKKSTG